MNDRLKYRIFYDNKIVYPNTWNDIESIYECLKQQIMWDCEIDTDIKFNHIANNLIFMQCTGLKDKNGKLVYEGDIVRYAEYEIEEIEPEWEYTEIVWGGSFDYPAFDLKQHNFDSNGLSEIFACGWTIEVIGNIYEKKEFENERNNFNDYSDSDACMRESAKQGE